MRRRQFITLLGSATAWPLAARAQQASMPVIGFLSARSPEDSTHLLAAFRGGLAEGGFVEGQNVAIEFRWARGQYDLLPAMAAELVSLGVSVLTTAGGDPSALAAKRATSTIPIVFGLDCDPVSAGLVESFNRPGGNATGVTLLTTLMEPKRLGLLRELVPGVPLVGVLVNPRFPTAPGSCGRSRRRRALVTANSYFDVRRDRIVSFAQRERLPAIYQFREYAVAGGLLSYGVDIVDGLPRGHAMLAPAQGSP
jgi:putative tryptophan/tyrosine transport system substrate-binding protein